MMSIRSIVISRALYTNSQEGGCLTYVGREGTVDFLLRQDHGIAAAQDFFRKAFATHANRPPQKVTLDGH